jgi:hypothetical protein
MAKRFISKSEEEREGMSSLEEELDIIRSFLVYTLMVKASLDGEDIYSYIYGNGKKILWN